MTTLCPMLAGILLYGVATIWIRERWACGTMEAAIFLCAAWALLRAPARQLGTRAWLLPGVFLLMGLWGVVQTAAGWTVVPADTAEAVLYWLAAACLAWLAGQVCTSRDRTHVFLKLLLAVGSTVCLLGLIQLFTSGGQVFWLFPSGYDSGVIGPFVSRNHYAAFVELLLPLALAPAFQERGQGRVYLVLAAGLTASVVASGSRTGTALVAAEAVAAFLLLVRTGRRGMGRRWAALAVLASAFILVVGYQYLWQRFTGERDPLEFRREFVQSSLSMVRAQPGHGFGLGAWPAPYRQFALIDTGLSVDHAHNEWVQWTAEGGMPALILMLAAAALCVPAALRSIWGLGIPAVLLHSLVDYPFLRLGLAAWIFVLMGILAGHGRERREREGAVDGKRWLARGLAPAAVPVLILATLAAGRTAWADHLYWKGTADGISRAARLRPDRAEYHFALAQTDEAGSITHLRRALVLNPFLTSARVLLASQLEAQGQLAASEAALLEGARRDRQYAPAWALTNFYFRTGVRERFWQWARTGAQISPGGMWPLFELCLAAEPDASTVWTRVAAPRPLAERELVAFLLARGGSDRGNLKGAYEGALGIAPHAGPEDRDTLLEYVDRALEAGQVEGAAEIWNQLCLRRLTPYPPLARGTLVNGDFGHATLNRGFDWRAGAAGCAQAARTHSVGDALEVFVSGRQPEECEIYSQFLRLAAGARYVLRYQYRTSDLPGPTGMRWSLGTGSEQELAASPEWSDGEWRWQAAAQAGRLAFVYRRSKGSTRREGTLMLRHVRLEADEIPTVAAAPDREED